MVIFEDNRIHGGSPAMSICDSGIGVKVCGKKMLIAVLNNHPLVLLSNQLPWEDMFDLVVNDLKNTTSKKQYYRGRKLKVRIHLAAYILQQMYNFTDRATEAAIKENAAYQIFCGREIVDHWHAPDHTKIERFRSRLTPETQQKLANLSCTNAVKLSLAEPSDLDVDSTVQEANITYPTDPKMLRKLGTLAFKAANGIKGIISNTLNKAVDLTVNVKTIASKARNCFFLSKNANSEQKSKVLGELWTSVSEPVIRIIDACKQSTEEEKASLRWNVQRAINQLLAHGEAYLSSAKSFIETGVAEANKRLSFHVDSVSCFNKKKAHKKYEFGRCFQLGRITGNFVFVKKSHNVQMNDKKSFNSVIEEHESLFGEKCLKSVATDKGYYSIKNVKFIVKRGIDKIGIQVPVNISNKHVESFGNEVLEELYNRRAGIEPLIGHIKQGGQLGRSRMKNDRTTESSAYASVFGFNLRQTMNGLLSREKEKAAVF